jgi:acetyl-CoA carboxylase, biotin carboxylase subunit
VINTVLIANRGEIASRIIRTCKKLGVKTIAVYSEADGDAEHVMLADEAYCIGGSRVQESYLNQEQILAVAKQASADAIHPGYGLLSEQASFATACKDNGLTFIGPSATAIALMGDKLQARKTMEAAGIPVIPGSGALASAAEAKTKAREIGFPVMVKAALGGGGIGIDVCRNEEEIEAAFARNEKKARMFFGDSSLYLEKLLERPRHIEIQVLADSNGHILAFGERECSIQRRHQKVVEEAPSPFLDQTTREAMEEMAKKAAAAIGYENAGTIECLLDSDGNYYFLEMNTRLQVEHPVTEEVFGIDLVEWQLRIADGAVLPWQQHELRGSGHAIEVRIYAEDPIRFFPSPGTIKDISLPKQPFIRHECPVRAGSVITPFYDPMIAKLIVKGGTRIEAITRLKEALNEYDITGVKTNLPLLRAICDHQAFIEGNTPTSFLNDYKEELFIKEREA